MIDWNIKTIFVPVGLKNRYLKFVVSVLWHFYFFKENWFGEGQNVFLFKSKFFVVLPKDCTNVQSICLCYRTSFTWVVLLLFVKTPFNHIRFFSLVCHTLKKSATTVFLVVFN